MLKIDHLRKKLWKFRSGLFPGGAARLYHRSHRTEWGRKKAPLLRQSWG